MTQKRARTRSVHVTACIIFTLLFAVFSEVRKAQAQSDDEFGTYQQQPYKQPEEAVKKEMYLFGGFELPLEDFAPAHFSRFAGDKEISIGNLVSTSGVILTPSRKLTKDDQLILEKEFGLKQERVIDKDRILFRFIKKNLTLDQLLAFINTQNNVRDKESDRVEFISAAFPIFLFSEGPQYLTGNIVIEWNEKVSERFAEILIDKLFLKNISFDPKTHIMIAGQTRKSGYNVFRLAQLFGPQNGNAYVRSVEPQYAPLEVPLTVTSAIEPADGKGQPGDIVGSAFLFIMDIRTKPSVRVELNELHLTADALKNWLPRKKEGENKDVSPQVFTVDGPETITESSHGQNEASDIRIVYRFRMSQSGEFSLAPPEVRYETYDRQQKKWVQERVSGAPAEFLASGTMPKEAMMVNDAASMPEFSPANPYRDGMDRHVFAAYCFVLAALAVLVLAIWGVASRLAKHDIRQPSFRELAETAWRAGKPALLDDLLADPTKFWQKLATLTREVLSLLAFGNADSFRAAGHKEIALAFKDTWDAASIEQLRTDLNTVFELHFDANRQRTFGETECLEMVQRLEVLIFMKVR